jgi:hypothetical protein
MRLVLPGRALAGALALGMFAGCESSPRETQTPPPAATPALPAVDTSEPARAYLGDLPPLPDIGGPAPRPAEVVAAVFTFAARHPEVLHYVPCFCGCQRAGHKNNDDCFIAGREADGRPRWEPHGMT